MRSKIFKTLDEQLAILEERGLVIHDYDKAKAILFRENYFFLNGYRHLFMNSVLSLISFSIILEGVR